jgi:hypothetical protein
MEPLKHHGQRPFKTAARQSAIYVFRLSINNDHRFRFKARIFAAE